MLIADGERELMFFQEQNSIFVSIFLHILSFQIYFSQCHASNLSHISFRPSPRLCHFGSFTRSGSTENNFFCHHTRVSCVCAGASHTFPLRNAIRSMNQMIFFFSLSPLSLFFSTSFSPVRLFFRRIGGLLRAFGVC